MKFWRFAVLYWAITALAGCRSGGDVQLLEDENFQLTERILQLEVQRSQLCQDLQSCRGQLAACEQALTSSDDRRRRDRNGRDSTIDGTPPNVELGPANDRQPTPAPRFEPSPKFEPGSTRQDMYYNGQRGPDVTQLHQTAMSSVPDQRVIRITLEPRETGGYDADDAQPGDEGIIVVVEPRNARGELVRVAGEIVIAAWDSQRLEQTMQQPDERPTAHVGTWNFNVQDAATWFLADEPRMKFELIWPRAGRPRNRALNIYVQYVTDDGRQLQAETQIRIQHTGQRPKKRTVNSAVENSASPSLYPTSAVHSDDDASISGAIVGEVPTPSSFLTPRTASAGLASPSQDEQKRPAFGGIRNKASASRENRRPVWRPYR